MTGDMWLSATPNPSDHATCPAVDVQVVPEVYSEQHSLVDSAKASAAAPSAATAADGPAWTQDRVAAEVQSALREVLGHSLEPDEPFMSGGQCIYA